MTISRTHAFAERQVDAAVCAGNHFFGRSSRGRRRRCVLPVLAHDPENEEQQREKEQVYHDVGGWTDSAKDSRRHHAPSE